jgi:hypothetical protein
MSWGIVSLRIRGAAFVHEAQHDIDANWLQSGCLSGCFIGAIALAAFPLEIDQVQI